MPLETRQHNPTRMSLRLKGIECLAVNHWHVAKRNKKSRRCVSEGLDRLGKRRAHTLWRIIATEACVPTCAEH